MAGTLRYLDKVVIVTGGSRGIGKGIVQVFVKNGAKVVFCALEEEEGRSLEEELNRTGPGTCLFVSFDVTKEEDLKNLISVTVERFDRIDCLINNAGWHPRHKTIDETTVEEFRHLLNYNLVSYFLATKGNVIHVASLVASIGKKLAVTYVAAKGAITAMTKAMAIDESRYSVRVNCISPGAIWTPMWEELAGHTENPAATIKAGEEAQLMGRMGTAAEIGLAALFLAADASYCTGVDLLVSGGAELDLAPKTQINHSSNVLTPLWEELAGHTENPAATIKAGEEAQLMGRMGTAAEIGLAALFLAADASYCTGVDLLVSGGAELDLACKTRTNHSSQWI